MQDNPLPVDSTEPSSSAMDFWRLIPKLLLPGRHSEKPLSSPKPCSVQVASPINEAGFHRFGDLPQELRLMIWNLASDPRVVYLRVKQLKSTNSEQRRYGVKSDAILPPILLVCKESFGVASKIYQRSFCTKHHEPETYFDFERDTLYLHLDDFALHNYNSIMPLSYLKQGEGAKDFSRVRNLALLVFEHSRCSNSLMRDVGDALSMFGRVQHLTMVACHYYNGLGHEQSNISFLAPFDVAATIAMYERWQRKGYRGVPEDLPLETGHVKINDIFLRHRCRTLNAKRLGEPFEIPDIQIAISVTGKTLTRYRELRGSLRELER